MSEKYYKLMNLDERYQYLKNLILLALYVQKDKAVNFSELAKTIFLLTSRYSRMQFKVGTIRLIMEADALNDLRMHKAIKIKRIKRRQPYYRIALTPKGYEKARELFQSVTKSWLNDVLCAMQTPNDRFLTFLDSFRSSEYSAKIFDFFGNNYLLEGRYDDALGLFQKNLRYFESKGDYSFLAKTYMNLADIHSACGDFNRAKSCYLEAANSYLRAATRTFRNNELMMAHEKFHALIANDLAGLQRPSREELLNIASIYENFLTTGLLDDLANYMKERQQEITNVIRLAALIHDIGHPVFSHRIELPTVCADYDLFESRQVKQLLDSLFDHYDFDRLDYLQRDLWFVETRYIVPLCLESIIAFIFDMATCNLLLGRSRRARELLKLPLLSYKSFRKGVTENRFISFLVNLSNKKFETARSVIVDFNFFALDVESRALLRCLIAHMAEQRLENFFKTRLRMDGKTARRLIENIDKVTRSSLERETTEC